MGLRRTTSNEIVKDIISDDPENLCSEMIRRAKIKWNERNGLTNFEDTQKIKYRRKTHNLLLTWNSLRCNNL